MVKITFHGGIGEIGGNQFLVEDGDTRILMDFGMSFKAEKDYFSEFLHARSSSVLKDMFKLCLLPDIKGLYREDHLLHDLGRKEATDIDAILLTHAHVDHCGYLSYVRPDIPVYCSPEARAIMQCFDDTSNTSQYTAIKPKFLVGESKTGLPKRITAKDEEGIISRNLEMIEPYKKIKIGSIQAIPLPVDHSISGVYAFQLETSSGLICNTADLRYHGRRSHQTEELVERSGSAGVDLMLCEGTRIDKKQTETEGDVEKSIFGVTDGAKGLVICNYPIRDLDRMLSFYNVAKQTGRHLVIDAKEAYLLGLFEGVPGSIYPTARDPNIRIYKNQGSWALVGREPDYDERILAQEYGDTWIREIFNNSDNLVDYRDIRKSPASYLFYCNDWKIQELVDIEPRGDTAYIRSMTEPFDRDMEMSDKRMMNWLARLGILHSEESWNRFHVSGHGDRGQLEKIVRGVDSKKLIPIHTEKPEKNPLWKKWHKDVITREKGESFEF